jgi:hypothetical protein
VRDGRTRRDIERMEELIRRMPRQQLVIPIIVTAEQRERMRDPVANAQAALRCMEARSRSPRAWATYDGAYDGYGRQTRRTRVWELLKFGCLFARVHWRDVLRRWWR